MNQKELKKLNRYQLLELLVIQTERADGLLRQVQELESKLEERELRLSQMGSIAEASMYLSGVFEASQKAADLYLENAQKQADTLLTQAQQQREEILAEARLQAEQIRNQAQSNAGSAPAVQHTAEKRKANGTGKQKKAGKKRASKNRRTKK